MKFFATAAKGTEPALRDELRELRLPKVRCDRGGVHFQGEWDHAHKVCLHSRIALRVFAPLGEFEAPSPEELYDRVRDIDWDEHLSTSHTLAVTAVCRSSEMTHTNFIAQKTKDAIVDQLRDRHGSRPSVDRKDPDVAIFVHLVKNKATVYLDLVGESLHRRGYRRRTTRAPLKETLAAAMLRLSGWDRRRPFIDPMCGSGTIAIEAALWASRIAPGLRRSQFGFERWPSFDQTAQKRLDELKEEARASVATDIPPIMARDLDPSCLAAAEANAHEAGVNISFEQGSVIYMEPLDPPGMVITNPPYGVRLDTDKQFHRQLGQVFRSLKGHRVGVLLGQRGLERSIPLKAEKFQILYNGDIECRLMVYQVP